MVMMPEWNEVTYQRSSQLDTPLGKAGLLMFAYVGFKTTYKSCDFIPLFFLSPFWVLINYFLFFFSLKTRRGKTNIFHKLKGSVVLKFILLLLIKTKTHSWVIKL